MHSAMLDGLCMRLAESRGGPLLIFKLGTAAKQEFKFMYLTEILRMLTLK